MSGDCCISERCIFVYTFGILPTYILKEKERRYAKRLTDVYLRFGSMCDLLPPLNCLMAASFAPFSGGKLWLVLVGFFVWSRNRGCGIFTTDDTIKKIATRRQATASSVREKRLDSSADGAIIVGHADATVTGRCDTTTTCPARAASLSFPDS
jgi:hypothetical protein